MSLIVNKIENFLEKRFDITFDNQYSLLSIAYAFFYISQLALYLVDAFFAVSGWRKVKKTDNIFFVLSFFLISAFYGVLFFAVEPRNNRIFGACGILASVQLILSTVYFFYVFLSTDMYDEQQLLYYTNRFAPVSMIYMTFLVCISVMVLCKMSFFRSYAKAIADLYDLEEEKGKKGV